MKTRLLNLLIVLTSLGGYLEWGGNNQTFLLCAEIGIVQKLFVNTSSVIHPFVLIPLAGQMLLVVTIFQKQPSRLLTFLGIAFIGLLLAFMFLIGILSLNYKILFSTLPFLISSALALHNQFKKGKD